jgi:ADP-ribose pyrophosphatase
LDSLDWLPPIWFLRIVLQQYKTEMSFKEMQREVLYAGKWLTMKAVHYKNPNNTPYVWECVERTTKCGDVDGVDVFAVLKMSDFPDRVVLELQYRPPVGKFILEFPAGLVDRGYVGEVVHVSGPLVLEPGLTSASTAFVHAIIDGNRTENKSPKQHLDTTEFIEVVLLPLQNLFSHMLALQKQRHFWIDSKLYTFAYSLSLAQGESPHFSEEKARRQ